MDKPRQLVPEPPASPPELRPARDGDVDAECGRRLRARPSMMFMRPSSPRAGERRRTVSPVKRRSRVDEAPPPKAGRSTGMRTW